MPVRTLKAQSLIWEGGRMIIAFDADADKNEQVKIARGLLARESWELTSFRPIVSIAPPEIPMIPLQMRGAEMACVTWEIAQGKGINDLLANVGAERVLQFLEAVDFEIQASEHNVSVHEIAEAITAGIPVSKCGTGT